MGIIIIIIIMIEGGGSLSDLLTDFNGPNVFHTRGKKNVWKIP